jgi:hypothetical protein
MQKIIEKIKLAYKNNTWDESIANLFYELWSDPPLEFLPDLELFISESKNEKFTEESLRMLGFYRDLVSVDEVERIKKTLQRIVGDSECGDLIREQAISQLGLYGEWPDLALRGIIANDSPENLKILAYIAILQQLKLPPQVIDLESHLVATGQASPTFHRINQVTQARADGHFDHLKT